MIGVGRREGVVEYEMLEHCVRDVLNRTAERRMAVLRPLKVVLTNYPEGQVEEFEAVNNPEDAAAGTRKVPFSRELFIEREDFMEDPPKKFFRLSPGREVRLRSAYFITCQEVVKDAAGEIVELRCTYDPQSRGRQRARRPLAQGHPALGLGDPCRAGRGAALRPPVQPRRPRSRRRSAARPEPAVGRGAHGLPPGARPRRPARGAPGCSSSGSATSAWTRTRPPGRPVFNRTVTLRDTWARVKADSKQGARS